MNQLPKAILAASVFALTAVVMNACDDSDGPGPTVTISTPATNDIYRSNESINIRWRATHNANMAQAQVRLRNTTDNADAYTDSPNVQNLQDFTYSEYESIAVTAEKSFSLFVTVTDVNGLSTEKSVNFTVRP